MTKSEKLRKASRACWIIGAVLTANFIRFVLADSIANPLMLWVASALIAAGFQYVITLSESALFDGSLPPIWRVQWKEGGIVPAITVGAVVLLVIDVFLNIGGVSMFTMKLEKATGDISALGIDSVMMGTLKVIITVAVATWFAIGSELLDAWADHIDGIVKAPRMWESKRPKPETKQVVEKQQAKQEVVEQTQTRQPKQELTDQQILERLHARRQQGGK